MTLKKLKKANPLNREEEKFYFAPVQGSIITLSEMAEQLSKTCSISSISIRSVLNAFFEELPFLLKNGHPVRLDPFCSIRLSVSSNGKENAEDLTRDDIKDVHIIVTPSARFKANLNSKEFIKSIKIIEEPNSETEY